MGSPASKAWLFFRDRIFDQIRFRPARREFNPIVVIVPVLGALDVAFLVKNFAPEARGAGTVALSYGLRRQLSKESVYMLKLVRRGHCIPEARHTNFHQLKKAGEVMDAEFVTGPALTRLNEFMAIVAEHSSASCFLARDAQRIVGVITKHAIPAILGQVGKPITAGDIANKDFITVAENMMISDVIAGMQAACVSVALITEGSEGASPDNVKGVITRQQIADALVQTMELFSDCQG